LHAIQVDDSIFDWSRLYLTIMFAGAVGVGFYNILSGIIRGLGDSVFPLLVLVATSLLNILLVYLFVGVFGFGIAGAAAATVTAQTASAVLCFLKIRSLRGVVDINKDTVKPRKEMVMHILRIGLPTGIQQVILTTSDTFVQALINGVSVLDIAGSPDRTIFAAAATLFTQVNAMAMLPSQAFSMGSSTFAGQNIGAGRPDRVKQGFIAICVTTLAVNSILFAIVYKWGGSVMTMYLDMSKENSEKIIEWGVIIQRIMVWNFICLAIMQPPIGVLRGLGNTMPVMWITIFCTVILRMPMAYIWVTYGAHGLADGGNYSGIYWSMVICTGIAALMAMGYYLSGRWKRRVVVKKAEETE